MSSKKRFLLRIDPDLYEALEKWAADEFRSVNAQIEFILRQVVMKEKKWIRKKDVKKE
jgi:hypothetical protein